MKTIGIVALVTLLSGSLSGQTRLAGTFIAAAVCEDGIVVASDSRSTFLDEGDHPFAYVDGMPKIFVNRGAAVAIAGLASMGEELLPSFIRRSSFLLDRSVDEILFGFAVNLPFKNTIGVSMLSAGFIQGQSRVCGKLPNDPQRCSNSGYFSNKDPAFLRAAFVKLGRIPKAQEAAAILKSAIEAAAQTDTTVGGPISILFLQNSAPPIWLENRPADQGWDGICDIVTAHRQGRRLITPVAAPELVTKRLDSLCPK